MRDLIEILPVGSRGDLFQVGDGERFGLLEMEESRVPWSATLQGIRARPEILEVLSDWLEHDGVLVGSPCPARILWPEVVRRLTRAA